MESDVPAEKNPWTWVPTLYLCEGLPYAAVMTLSVVMYKSLGVSNDDIAFHTSWLYLPWVIKPLWSPFLELAGTRRRWIVLLQPFLAVTLAAVAVALPAPGFLPITLAIFWLMAFASATHDIAVDGFYLLALGPKPQAAFVGVRSLCYKIAVLAGQGGLVVVAGKLGAGPGEMPHAWALVFLGTAAGFAALGFYHLVTLPRPRLDVPAAASPSQFREYFAILGEFFRKEGIVAVLAFLLLYRFAEAQLLKMVPSFLLDPRSAGGLGLTVAQEGWIYGTAGQVGLIAGGLLGGWAIARQGLSRWLWPMIAILYLPNLVFILLAATLPQNLGLIGAALTVEQFGYGFGFTAYLVVMMRVASGAHRTAHYALCTGFMALGMMLPGIFAGKIQLHLGYTGFFVWVCIAAIPSFVATAWIRRHPACREEAA